MGQRFLFTVLAGASVSISCARAQETCSMPALPAEEQVLAVENEIYARPTDKENVAFDFYRPVQSTDSPLVIFIHGGGWSAGDKESFRDEARRMTSLGYASATLQYRLVKVLENRFPAAVEDVRCAVRYLRRNAARLGFNPQRIGAVGTSAGGHLSAMLGTAEFSQGLDGDFCEAMDESPGVQSAVSYYAPLDLTSSEGMSLAAKTMLFNFLGFWPELFPARAALASPKSHIHNQTPPMHLVHGDQDDLVPVRSSREFTEALALAGRPFSYVEMPGAGHSFGVLSDDPQWQPSMCSTLSFLHRTLN